MTVPMLQSTENATFPIVGKIRLGITKVSSKTDNEFPDTVPHFVLTDAPNIERVYGKEPKELDVFFLSDDIEAIIPTFWKWYGGTKKDSHGKRLGGTLKCRGCGPNADGTPGTAWHHERRDPVTRIIPERPCAGSACPDAIGPNGKPQCSPSMTVYVFVPRADLFGVYQIDTKSVISMQTMWSMLNTCKQNFGRIQGIPFKLVRDPMSLGDPKNPGAKRPQYIMKLTSNMDFEKNYGNSVALQIQQICDGAKWGKPTTEMLEAPTEDLVAMLPEETSSAGMVINTPAQGADLPTLEEIANRPDVTGLFNELAKLRGIPVADVTLRKKVLTIKNHEKAPDICEAVKAYLIAEITKLTPKQNVDASGMM